jgi:glycosyltransferase involved in cell wall biosynthesis
MKNTVYHIIPSLVSRGQGRFIAQLMSGLSRSTSWQGRVYYFNASKDFELSNSKRVRFWDKQNFEIGSVIHTHNLRGDLYVLYQVFRGGKHFKWVSTLHQDVAKDLAFKFYRFDVRRYVLRYLFRVLLFCHDHVVCLTGFMQSNLLKNYKVGATSVIGNAVDTSSSRIFLDQKILQNIDYLRNEGKILVVNACNITRGKALDQVIDLLVYNQDVIYFLFGEGMYKEELLKKVELHGLKDRFVFLGDTPLAYRYFPYFDILLFTSYSEGFPITILEAASLKVPIVCSRLPMIEEAYPNSCLYYFANDRLDDLNLAIEKAHKDSQGKIETMYYYYLKNYTVDVMTEKYVNLYNRIVNE